MNNKSSVAPMVALVAVIIAIVVGALWVSSGAPLPGASTPGSRYPHGITIGDAAYSPTNLALVKVGTCNAAMAGTPAATSSSPATCTVTGARSGDIVAVQLPQAGAVAAAFGGFVVSGTSASTDGITFNIFNYTGAATTSFPLATTSVQYQVYRAQ